MKNQKKGGFGNSVIKFIWELLSDQKFYISLIIPTILGIFIPLLCIKKYIIIFSFLMGLSSYPLILTIKEKLKEDAN